MDWYVYKLIRPFNILKSKILLQYFTNQLFYYSIMLLKYLANLKVKSSNEKKVVTTTIFTPSPRWTLLHLPPPVQPLSVPNAILNLKKNRFRFGKVKNNTIYALGGNNESGTRSRQVPVWRGLISVVSSVINSGPNNYYGIDIPVCTGSGMYRLHGSRPKSMSIET